MLNVHNVLIETSVVVK